MSPPPSAMGVSVLGLTDTTGAVVPDPILGNGTTFAIFGIDDVLPHRRKSAPMPQSVAAFGSSDMFKSHACFQKPRARRWDHRLSAESKSRHPSSLKSAMKHFTPGMISLGGGLPSSDYFPFDEVSVKVPMPSQYAEGRTVVAGKHDIRQGKSAYDLSVALNYGQSMGAPQLLRFVTEHTEIVHNPPYADWECTLTVGSTSALDMCFRMFATRGDYLLTEEYSFSSAVECAAGLGLRVLGVKMDSHGLLPDSLDDILTDWDPVARCAPKPFLLYTVPTGHNPTGSTQSLSRRRAIYAVAEKHDLIILEDEPYYFLQMEPYRSQPTINPTKPTTPSTTSPTTFLTTLIPSYLSLDASSRVLRLDSFSKILSPGSRTGWLTGPSQLIERFIRHSEVSTQTPSGFSQIILFKLLDEAWGHTHFLEWLMYLRVEYTRRRDVIVRAAEQYLPHDIATWTAPMAGMFFWIRLNHTRHPSYTLSKPDAEQIGPIEEKIFHAALAQGVLCSRGSWFRAQRGSDTALFFRATFAAAGEIEVSEAMRRFGNAVKQEFGLESMQAQEGRNGEVNGTANGHAH